MNRLFQVTMIGCISLFCMSAHMVRPNEQEPAKEVAMARFSKPEAENMQAVECKPTETAVCPIHGKKAEEKHRKSAARKVVDGDSN
jgi:hypothetical protein